MLKKITNPCNLYVILWLFGYIQNIYFDSSLLSMVFYIPSTLMTMYYVKEVILNCRTTGVMKVMLCFFLFLCVYGVGLLLYNDAVGQDPKSFLMMFFRTYFPILRIY